MRALVLTAVSVVLSGCGGFDNTPFLPALVEGVLPNVDRSLAIVAVRDGARSAVPDLAGHFVLEDVPPGVATLFVVASDQGGALIEVTVRGGQVNRLGTLTLERPARLEIELEAPAAQRLDQAVVTLDGVPAHVSPCNELGEGAIGPLPAGCYQLDVKVPGFSEVNERVCLAPGEEREFHLRMPEPDGHLTTGCVLTGCLSGYFCERSTGRCEQ